MPPPQTLTRPISPTTEIKGKKRRRALTDADRKDIREYYFHTKKKACSQKAIKNWFWETHYHHITQSQVSDILSDKYSRLDDVKKGGLQNRFKEGQWPDLEEALFEWQSRVNRKGGTVTGDLLREKAEQLYTKLPQYHGQEAPKFSEGWLGGFKKRFKIHRYRRFGEAASVDRVTVETELSDTRVDIKEYELRDIYNMDESALFWKMMPDATLADQQLPGGKIEKARVTINLCCNADGSKKLPPWFIGKAKTPRCFGRASVKIQNFKCIWKHNTKGWMTGVIFKEYLKWMDLQVAPRKSILLIDGFSAHQTGLDLFHSENENGLGFITVIFLPANATSICQPLDQGIIKAWKAHYRRRFLRYVISEYNDDKDPFKTMNVLQALRWGIDVWDNDITENTIYRCWLKSRLLVGRAGGTGEEHRAVHSGWTEYAAENDQEEEEARSFCISATEKLKQQNRIKKAMYIGNFLNPVEERVDDKDEDILELVVQKTYSKGPTAERAYESDEEDLPQEPRITEKEAIQLLKRLRLYEEQQDDGDDVTLNRLNRYERDINARSINTKEQATLDRFFR